MLITRLELTDFKSYERAEVRFQPGTNAIVGENGSGKSSMREAIGFALFDAREDTVMSYVREGAREATIVVTFISSLDEREYEVERRLGKGASRYRVYDVELGRRQIAEGNTEALDWLRRHLRVDGSADLETLFRNTVGIPQGAVTSAFLATPAERKAVFDPLLQVSDYDVAAAKLNDTRKYLSEQHNALRIEIAGMTAQVDQLPTLTAEQSRLESDLSAFAQELAALQTSLTEAQSALQAHEQRKDCAVSLRQQAEGLRTRRDAQSDLLRAAQHSLTEAEQAAERVAAAFPGHEAYLAVDLRLRALEEQRRSRDALRSQRAGIDQQLAQLGARLERLSQDLQESEQAAQRVADLQEAVQRQTALEADREAARRAVHSLAEARRRLQDATRELDEAHSHRARIEQALAQAGALDAQHQACEREIADAQQRRQALIGQQAACAADLARLDEQTAALSAIDTARCPVCESELTEAHRSELLQRNADRDRELRAARRTLADELDTLSQHDNALRRQRDRLTSALRALPGADALEGVQQQVERRMQAAAEAESEATALAEAPQQLERAETALRALDDPRQRAAQEQAIASRRRALEREQAEAAHANERLAAEQSRLEDQLAQYADLEATLESLRAERDAHAADHDAYLGHRSAADQRDKRAQQVSVAQQTLAATQTQWEQLQAEADAASGAYQPEAHDRAARRVLELSTTRAAKGAQEEERRTRLTTVRDDIVALQEIERALATRQSELAELDGLLSLVGRVRELLKNAGPEITRQRVRRISLMASQLYADIMGDHRNRLVWAEDYGLTLEVKGQTRSFRQLSGGEQMAAALALRLALLRETSSIDIAFFDEPTAHLDPERRGNLAEQIMNVKGFQQLFVISHDDSFEALAQSHVRVTKDEHGSRVETD
ncbi:MAG: SMC family ATPase [Chloroflexi bacterium]|nr:SMC family ATPase [Chloroflexota bacterium]